MSDPRLKIVRDKLNFETVDAADISHDRKGKHNGLIVRILQDLQRVAPDVALKIPLASLGKNKTANIRAALAREIKKTELVIGTSMDDDYLYVWRKNE